jgi:hypothetical protein
MSANTTGIYETIQVKGGFYIGDPCYALRSDLYEKWCDWGCEREKTEGHYCNDGKFVHDGKDIMICDSTYLGDGWYDGTERDYPVDAGCLAIIPLEFCDPSKDFSDYGLIVKDYNGEVRCITDGDTGRFLFTWDSDDFGGSETIWTAPSDADEDADEDED